MTGGRGDYHMQFLRYDEVPSHVAQKLIEESKKEQEEAKSLSEPGGGGGASPPPRRDSV